MGFPMKEMLFEGIEKRRLRVEVRANEAKLRCPFATFVCLKLFDRFIAVLVGKDHVDVEKLGGLISNGVCAAVDG